MRPRYQVVSRNLSGSRSLGLLLCKPFTHTHTRSCSSCSGCPWRFSVTRPPLPFVFSVFNRHSGLMAAGLLFFGHIRTFPLTRCRLSTPRVAHNLAAITLWSHWWRVFSAHLSLFLCLELRLPGSALSTLAGCLTKFGSQPVRLRSPTLARFTAIVNFPWQP